MDTEINNAAPPVQDGLTAADAIEMVEVQKVRFECRAMPALSVVVNGRKLRFAGGFLSVDPTEAPAVREYARTMGHLNIVEIGNVTVEQPAPTGPVTDQASGPKMSMSKDELIDLAVSRGMDRDEAGTMTKSAIIDALGGETSAD